MQRGVTVQQVCSAVHLCKSHGIQTGMFLMWGYDGEEIEDIEQTVAHAKACQPDVCFTTVSYPIKGTPYYDRVSSRLVTLGEWANRQIATFASRGGIPGDSINTRTIF